MNRSLEMTLAPPLELEEEEEEQHQSNMNLSMMMEEEHRSQTPGLHMAPNNIHVGGLPIPDHVAARNALGDSGMFKVPPSLRRRDGGEEVLDDGDCVIFGSDDEGELGSDIIGFACDWALAPAFVDVQPQLWPHLPTDAAADEEEMFTTNDFDEMDDPSSDLGTPLDGGAHFPGPYFGVRESAAVPLGPEIPAPSVYGSGGAVGGGVNGAPLSPYAAVTSTRADQAPWVGEEPADSGSESSSTEDAEDDIDNDDDADDPDYAASTQPRRTRASTAAAAASAESMSMETTPSRDRANRNTPSRRATRNSGGSGVQHRCGFPGCGTTFAGKAELAEHQQVHKGARPYVCGATGCTAAFAQASNLRRHKRIHTNEKPYACDQCFTTFSQSSNLNAHLRRVHKIERSPQERIAIREELRERLAQDKNYLRKNAEAYKRATTQAPTSGGRRRGAG